MSYELECYVIENVESRKFIALKGPERLFTNPVMEEAILWNPVPAPPAGVDPPTGSMQLLKLGDPARGMSDRDVAGVVEGILADPRQVTVTVVDTVDGNKWCTITLERTGSLLSEDIATGNVNYESVPTGPTKRQKWIFRKIRTTSSYIVGPSKGGCLYLPCKIWLSIFGK